MPSGVIQGVAANTRIARGTSTLVIGASSFLTDVTVLGNQFSIGTLGQARIDYTLFPLGVQNDVPYTIQLFNATLGAIVDSASRVAAGTADVPVPIPFTFVFNVTDITHLYEFRIFIGDDVVVAQQVNAINLQGLTFRAVVGSLQGGGGGSTDPVVVDLGVLGAAFSPAVAKATTVIVAVVNAPFTMTDLTITDGVVNKLLIRVELTQGAVGGDISSWNAANFVGSDLVPLTSVGLSVGVGKTDVLVLEWDTTRAKWMLVGFFNGIAP